MQTSNASIHQFVLTQFLRNVHGVCCCCCTLQDVFKSVERLCDSEGIDCAKFMYRDNTTILDTLEGGRCGPRCLRRRCICCALLRDGSCLLDSALALEPFLLEHVLGLGLVLN